MWLIRTRNTGDVEAMANIMRCACVCYLEYMVVWNKCD